MEEMGLQIERIVTMIVDRVVAIGVKYISKRFLSVDIFPLQ